MAEYIGRIIGYLILLGVSWLCYFFLHSHFYFIVLVLMIAAPFFSILFAWYLSKYASVTVTCKQMRDVYGKQGELACFCIQVRNLSWFTCLDAKLDVCVENRFFETEGTQVVSIPIYARKGYELELPIVATYPGMLSVKVTQIRIKDLMGFCFFKKKADAAAELCVLPAQLPDVQYEKTALEQGMLESEESTKRGNDFSDVQDIREYIPGDKLMSIHWKLSAKRDILMVKDRVSMSDRQLVVVPELCLADHKSLVMILSACYSVMEEMLRGQTTVRLMYWSVGQYAYVDVRVENKAELEQAFAEMFYEKAYKTADEATSHMALVHPEIHAYLHIYADASGVQIEIRENG